VCCPARPRAAWASAGVPELQLGLLGLTNSGKTALFNLVTGGQAEVASYPFTTREPNRGVADVPDSRIDAIADVQSQPALCYDDEDDRRDRGRRGSTGY
jgi:ribosome-interacting GTPase 1